MKKGSLLPWIVCICGSLFFLYEFFQINMFNALDPHLIKEFNTDAPTLGFLSSTYFYGTVLLLFPAGLILDRFSTRKVIISALTVSIIGTTIFALSESLLTAVLGRFLVGISGGPFGLISTIRLASRWFPLHKMAFVTGIIIATGMLGGVIAQMPFTKLVDFVGWRNAVFIDALVGITILVAILFTVKDYPKGKEQEFKNDKNVTQEIGFFKSISLVFKCSQNWICGTFVSLLNLPIFLLGALWGGLYLEQVHNLTRMQASNASTMLFIGMLIGSPLFGKFSDKIKLRRTPMMVGATLTLGMVLIVMHVQNLSYFSILICFLLMGFGSSAQIIGYPTVLESNHSSLLGASEGLAAVLIMAGGAIFQPLFGYLLKLNWSGLMADGHPLYSNSNFYSAMLLLPISILVSILMILIMKETYCKKLEDTNILIPKSKNLEPVV